MPWGVAAAAVGAAGSAYSANQASKAAGKTTTSMQPWMEDSSRQFYDRLTDSDNRPGVDGFWSTKPGEGYNPQFYEGRTQAQMPKWFRQDLKDYTKLGADSSTGQAEQFYQNQVAGDYLGLSPDMQAAVMNPAMDASASRFAQMGRSGLNPANVQSMNSSGMAALMPYFNDQQQRQMYAAGQLPGFDQRRMDASQLRAGYQMDQRQGLINDDMRRNEFDNNKWLDRMKQNRALMPPDMGGSTTTTQPGGSWLGGALSGGLMGYSMYDNYMKQAQPQPNSYGDPMFQQTNGQQSFQMPQNFGGNYSAALGGA